MMRMKRNDYLSHKNTELGLHKNTVQLGIDKMIALIKDRLYWLGINKTLEDWIGNCDRWMSRKTAYNIKAP